MTGGLLPPMRTESRGPCEADARRRGSASGMLEGTYSAAKPDLPAIQWGVTRPGRAPRIEIRNCVRRRAAGTVPAH
jgi:hypothetical protein